MSWKNLTDNVDFLDVMIFVAFITMAIISFTDNQPFANDMMKFLGGAMVTVWVKSKSRNGNGK